MNRNAYTNRSDPRENRFYPRCVSNHADALLDELDEAQVARLFHALHTKTRVEWEDWLAEHRAAIEQYDRLSVAERRKALRADSGTERLLWHHACVYLELWRCHVEYGFFHIRHNADLPESATAQRELLLAIHASLLTLPERAVWPWVGHPEYGGFYPFREG